MSDNGLKAFLPKILSDSKLQDQLKNLTDKSKFTQTLIALGKEKGYNFSAEDVDAALFKNKQNPLSELSEADLATVAGGLPPATKDGCGAAWTTLFGWCT